MAQTFILRADMTPLAAVASGADSSICGQCKHRGTAYIAHGIAQYHHRSCYVTVAQSPQSVFRAYQRGVYLRRTAADVGLELTGQTVRLGAYGDPAAVPVEVWQALTAHTKSHTGYTHQWTRDDSQAYRTLIMASVDTPDEYAQAHGIGWRTFRVRTADQALTANEIACPASEEMQYRTTCQRCGLCAGSDKIAKSIAILAHGAGARSFVTLASLRDATR